MAEPSTCPYLGSLAGADTYTTYPSFQNRCFVTGRAEPVSREEQVTYCLKGKFAACPHYRKAHASHAPADDILVNNDRLPILIAPHRRPPQRRGRVSFPYLALGCLILLMFACLSIGAGIATLRLFARPTTPTAAAIPPSPTGRPARVPLVSPVTPTPTLVSRVPARTPVASPSPLSPSPARPSVPTFTPTPYTPHAISPLPTPTPRPTPTPLPPTFTPISTFPTPTPVMTIRSFIAQPVTLDPGQCSTLTWNVVGAWTVYLNDESVGPFGTRVVCPIATTTYVLEAVDFRGASETRTLTVTVRSTPTPTATPTWTPTPVPSPTPTPFPSPTPTPTPTPTATPTPTVTPTVTPTPFLVLTPFPTATPTPTPEPARYAFTVFPEAQAVDGKPGDTVAVLFRVLNSGTAPDGYEVRAFGLRSGWSVNLCVVNCYLLGPLYSPTVAAGKQFRFSLRVDIPQDATPGDALSVTVVVRSAGDPALVWQRDISFRVIAP